MKGSYFYGDRCGGKIWGLRKSGDACQIALLRDPKTPKPPLTTAGL